jgi:hypothetical protein
VDTFKFPATSSSRNAADGVNILRCSTSKKAFICIGDIAKNDNSCLASMWCKGAYHRAMFVHKSGAKIAEMAGFLLSVRALGADFLLKKFEK